MKSKRNLLTVLSVLLSIGLIHGCGKAERIEWVSPYTKIDWDKVIQAKAQFHTHTTVSDGWFAPHAVVDTYHEMGYKILSITDHWISTYPWQEFTSFEPSRGTYRRLESGDMNGLSHNDILEYENRYPESLGMLAIQGAEPSHGGKRKHHMLSLFSNVTGREMGFEETLAEIEEAGGLVSFAHPARDTEWNNNTVDDYIYYLETYQQIYGMDIFSSLNLGYEIRWERAKQLIADILMHFGSPTDDCWRPLWLTSIDDMHSPHQYHSGFQIQLLDQLDKENVYNSLKEGAFFWVAQSYGAQEPTIESINFERTSITVKGKGYDHVSWYFDNEIIHTGETFDYFEHGSDDIFYVYFMAHTSDFSVGEETGTAIGSQPIWITKN